MVHGRGRTDGRRSLVSSLSTQQAFGCPLQVARQRSGPLATIVSTITSYGKLDSRSAGVCSPPRPLSTPEIRSTAPALFFSAWRPRSVNVGISRIRVESVPMVMPRSGYMDGFVHVSIRDLPPGTRHLASLPSGVTSRARMIRPSTHSPAPIACFAVIVRSQPDVETEERLRPPRNLTSSGPSQTDDCIPRQRRWACLARTTC